MVLTVSNSAAPVILILLLNLFQSREERDVGEEEEEATVGQTATDETDSILRDRVGHFSAI